MPYILGLTGNIASGKTTVGLTLLELGAFSYTDADHVVHELYLPGQPLVARLAETFGQRIIAPDGGVDRKVLGEVVFNDRAALRQLEAQVHPAVQTALIARLRAIPSDGVGVLDAVKLVEGGYAPLCHAVWVVTCPESLQLQRLVEQRGLSSQEAQARLAAQPPLAAKIAAATEVIDNSGSLDDLRDRVEGAWQRFRATMPNAG